MAGEETRWLGKSSETEMTVYCALFGVLALGAAHPVCGPGGPAAPGTIAGIVRDVNNGKVPGATVVVRGAANDSHTAVTDDQGRFEVGGLKPGGTYGVTVSADGFAEWTSPGVIASSGPGQESISIQLAIEAQHTAITVNPYQEALALVKVEEKQRALVLIPNFFEVFCPNPPPLTAKLKFRLAFRTATDPFTFAAAAILSGPGHSARTPNFGEGVQGFAERFGVNYGNEVSYIMLGGAVLPSLLHQDPRYYYQGKGTWRSRAFHAVSNAFVTRGDNGRLEPNYSDLGGNLISSAISNAYYPAANRGARQVFQSFAINLGVRMTVRLLQEFLIPPAKSGACPPGQ